LPVSNQYPRSKLADLGNAAAGWSARARLSEELSVEEQIRMYAGPWWTDEESVYQGDAGDHKWRFFHIGLINNGSGVGRNATHFCPRFFC
jgi:hypothetical protein